MTTTLRTLLALAVSICALAVLLDPDSVTLFRMFVLVVCVDFALNYGRLSSAVYQRTPAELMRTSAAWSLSTPLERVAIFVSLAAFIRHSLA